MKTVYKCQSEHTSTTMIHNNTSNNDIKVILQLSCYTSPSKFINNFYININTDILTGSVEYIKQSNARIAIQVVNCG